MDEYQRERERIAGVLCLFYKCREFEQGKVICPDKTCSVAPKVDQILSGGNLLVKADDQSLPFSGLSIVTIETREHEFYYDKGQQNMLQAGFVKAVKK